MSSFFKTNVLRASPQGLEIIDCARKKKGWKKTSATWCEKARATEATLKRFWRGIPIRQDAFIGICQAVGIMDWKQIADAIPETEPNVDWGEAPDVTVFYGRERELAILEQWLITEHCRLVALSGMGGIGKTALSVKLAKQLQEKFDCVIWRSLHQAPPLQHILSDWLDFLYPRRPNNCLIDINDSLSLLLDCLRRHRCLLILDNFEAILRSGDFVGHYKEGYKVYGELLKRVGETPHQSCLLIASREKLREIALLEGETLPIRSYQLEGLGEEAREILKEKSLLQPEKWATLINIYRGNPFMLKIVSAFIKEVFDGRVGDFLKLGTTQVTRDISDFIEVHLERLSELERKIISRMALEKEPVSLSDLQESLSEYSLVEFSDALASLIGRSLVEKSAGYFALQPVVMEYITNLNNAELE